MNYKYRSAMLLSLLLSLLMLCQPIASFEINYDTQPAMSWPFSLDDCQELASNQPARWKQTFRFCMTLFFNKPRDFPGSTDQSNPLQGVAMTTKAKFRDTEDISTGVVPLMALKQSDEDFQSGDDGDDETDNIFSKGGTRINHGEEEGDDGNKQASTLWTQNNRPKKWSSVIGRAVLRTRRQHSLSINSALVSLADMLMTRDYNRQKARQRAFRQQLLGLGR